ncbi:MAG TPA: DUF2283 domain-containing protein [Candidatus Nanoarchaeia archaeon]|nr:DUF2283 domain-containing protein [Candidatus Nanoarchaeia archaeon]
MAQKKITLDYDEEADVLYFTFGEPKEALTEEMGNIGVRVNSITHEIVGLTVIDFLSGFKKKRQPLQISVGR